MPCAPAVTSARLPRSLLMGGATLDDYYRASTSRGATRAPGPRIRSRPEFILPSAVIRAEHAVHYERRAARGFPGARARAAAEQIIDHGLDERLRDVRQRRKIKL